MDEKDTKSKKAKEENTEEYEKPALVKYSKTRRIMTISGATVTTVALTT